MFNFIQNCMHNNYITEKILFQDIDLIQNYICVQHNVMWEWKLGTFCSRFTVKDQVVFFMATLNTTNWSTPNIISEIVLSDDLKKLRKKKLG